MTTVRIDEVHGKGNGIVRFGGVHEAVHAVGEQRRYPYYIVNFAVNHLEPNTIVNFAENYSETAV